VRLLHPATLLLKTFVEHEHSTFDMINPRKSGFLRRSNMLSRNGDRWFKRSRLASGFLLLCLGLSTELPAFLALGQQSQSDNAAATTSQSASGSGEMAVKDENTSPKDDEAATFRVNVRLVLARVVVRDSNGRAIGNLGKEDFELFDNGKIQSISHFDLQHNDKPSPTAAVVPSSQSPTPISAGSALQFPVRYVAYLFDDIHLKFQDLASARNAAHHRIDSLAPTERAAIFSTSGQTTLDFTDDRAKLHQTLNELTPRPVNGGELNPCPNISFYEADLIANKQNPEALQTAISDYLNCANLPISQTSQSSAALFIQARAPEIVNTGEQESRRAIEVLGRAVRRIQTMPGQRTLVLVSPGFLTPELEYDYYGIIDQALRAQVVISALDARGLWVTIPGGEASQAGQVDVPLPDSHSTVAGPPGAAVGSPEQGFTATSHAVLDSQAAKAQEDIMMALAYGTGGNFFHNNNDMNEGFRRLSETPEYYYILGFSPQNLKTDGKFHTLKVRLKSRQKYDLQARSGYYAPKHSEDAAEEAKREIDDEVLSSEELHDLPVAVHTQFFKPSDDAAKLTVLARVDVKRLHYKQSDGRNENNLTVVTAVFDRNGNFLQSNQKIVTMRWKNETLQGRLASGITLRSSFDVKPGRYVVRVVARDTEQQMMSAENGAVEIP